MNTQSLTLQAIDITKRFPGVLANDHIDLALEQGEILSLLDSGLQEGLSGFAELFGPANEFEIGYQLRRLQKLSLTYAKVSRALDAIRDRDPTGAQAIDLS